MRGSDNRFPSLRVVETADADVGVPGVGSQRLYIDPVTHLLKRKNSDGDSFAIGGGGGAVKVGPFTVNFDDADIATGVELFTPSVGDYLADAYIETMVAFTFSGGGSKALPTIKTDNDTLFYIGTSVGLAAATGGTDVTQQVGGQLDATSLAALASLFGFKVGGQALPAFVRNAVPIKLKLEANSDTMTAGQVRITFWVIPA